MMHQQGGSVDINRFGNIFVYICIAGCGLTEVLLWRYNISSVIYRNSYYYGVTTVTYYCGYSPSSTGPCTYLNALGSVSLFFNILMAVVRCILRGGQRGTRKGVLVADLLTTFFNLCWWLAGGIVLLKYYNDALTNGAPSSINSYRKGAYAVAWTAFSLACVGLIFSILHLRAFFSDPDCGDSSHQIPPQNMDVYGVPGPQPYAVQMVPGTMPAAGYAMMPPQQYNYAGAAQQPNNPAGYNNTAPYQGYPAGANTAPYQGYPAGANATANPYPQPVAGYPPAGVPGGKY